MAKWRSNTMSHRFFRCFLIAVIFLIFSDKDSYAGESSSNIAYFSAYPKATFDPCKEMIIEISGIRLAVQKTKLNKWILFPSGRPFKLSEKEFNVCDQIFVPNIYSINPVIGFTVSRENINDQWHGGAYSEDIYKKIMAYRKQKKTKVFSNGVETINFNGLSYFILPLTKAPTKNKEPVVLLCSNYCRTGYTLPNGLQVEYYLSKIGFFNNNLGHAEYPEEKILQLDQEQRAILEAMINKAKSVNINSKMEK
jgi:hypothetical protein